MRTHRLTLLFVAFVVLAPSTPVLAQTYDHLLCYKVKSAKAFSSATVNLNALAMQYGLSNCSLKPKLKQICFPVDKNVVSLTDGSPLSISGQTDAVESLCYQVKCPVGALAPATFSDQFGSHELSKFKPSLLCAPAVAGAVTPTTTLPCSPSAETCNAIDDDCDGMTDEDLGTSSCGTGGCARTVNTCDGGSPQSCIPGSPAAEICNNQDDDCDGMADEGLGTVTCGTGACFVEQISCVGGMPQSCTPGSPSTEQCGNGIDDDCDGQVDEPGCL